MTNKASDITKHSSSIGGGPVFGGEVKAIIQPGDVTVNYLLAFFSLFLAPVLSLVMTSEIYEYMDWWQKCITVFGLTFLVFMFIMKTSTGIKCIRKIVTYIQKTSLK